jgi:hypothetical protein
MDIDINDSAGSAVMMDFTDSTLWNKLLRKGVADQAPAAFTSTSVAATASNTSSSASVSVLSATGVVGVGGSGVLHPALLGHRYTGDGDMYYHQQLQLPQKQRRLSARGSGNSLSGVVAVRALYEKDLFLVMSKPVLEILLVLWDNAYDDQLVRR